MGLNHTKYISLLMIAVVHFMVFLSQASASDVTKPAITGADVPNPKSSQKTTIDKSLPPLQIEKTGNVRRLPASYPSTWVMVDESSFFGMASGKVIIIDLAETHHPKRIKGIIDKSLLGNFGQSKTRGEIYLMESFHQRGTRGPKEDVLSIYDKQTLTIKKEIVWPKPNRLQSLPERFAMSLSADEQFLFSANFDPAASFTVIDLDTQEITAEIATAGCVLTYPVGNRAIASICSNGSMLTTQITDQGTLKSQERSDPFFDTDKTPIFENASYIGNIAYFWSFKGVLHSFDMSADQAVYIGQWDPLSVVDKSSNMRPSGLLLSDVDDKGHLYTIFQNDGHEGTQTHGGSQVRVYDPANKKLIKIIKVPRWAITLAVTRGENPLLVVTNGELNLDVFNATDGSFVQTIRDFGNTTPLSMHKSY